ncbi:XRE family transcriptional regulator [uncultured Sneathiella sp.]|uniref:XRE family transcriptional regulator n=1 Tax=uncultured Sneathiella sp. TaxID=879315 RepID=UPI00259768BB|nr:XRE family transcriptional regulator [uncultured Sneathiella sp.]
MNAGTQKAPKLPFNEEMLKWARNWRGKTLEETAKKFSVDINKIWEWENGVSSPTVRQARGLAKYYDRSFLEFFYDSPPNIHETGLIPDFRVHRGAMNPRESREILAIQHWAEAQRLNALELFEEIDEQPIDFPKDLFATIEDDVENVAIRAREKMSFTILQQKRIPAKDKYDLPKILREKIESLGILVLRNNDLAKHEVSGFCIAEFPLPIIAFCAESPGRQAFTLMHEFAHIVLRESAISSFRNTRKAVTVARKVERWCNKFAAAFLIPESAVDALRFKPNLPSKSFDENILQQLAKTFKVSPHAMMIRLVDLNYIDPDYYWTVKRPQYLEEEQNYKSSGRSKYWASRNVNSLGPTYTSLVLEAWGTGRIPFHIAADYMGLKRPSHLSKIREEFDGN